VAGGQANTTNGDEAAFWRIILLCPETLPSAAAPQQLFFGPGCKLFVPFAQKDAKLA